MPELLRKRGIAMKQGDAIGNKAYIKVIKALQRLFSEQYKEGGWLPPGHEMAERLGVCHKTYCKAISRMTHEGFARSFHGKGHYVNPERLRCRKLGVVIGDGTESPFIPEFSSFLAAMSHVRAKGFEVQIIQCSRMEQLLNNAVAHGVEGLLWFNPPRQAARHTSDIHDSGEIPLVLIQCDATLSGVDFGAFIVCHDAAMDGRASAMSMLKRGHRSFAIISDFKSEWHGGVTEALAESGIDAKP
jgi:DNA-binding LacI/PurR family transcriptional regulator